MTQAELAAKARIPRFLVSLYESGHVTLSPDVQARVAAVLEVPRELLFSEGDVSRLLEAVAK